MGISERRIINVIRFTDAVRAVERENFRPGDALNALDAATEEIIPAPPRGAVSLTAEESQCIICALAGNFPERFSAIRPGLIRKLTKVEVVNGH